MNDNNFEQQFMQGVRDTASQPSSPANTNINPSFKSSSQKSSSRLPLVISIILAVTVFIETTILLVWVINLSAFINAGGEVPSDYVEEIDSEVYTFDENDDLTAVNIVCTSEANITYSLSSDNKYRQYDSSSTLDSGTYSITNYSLISLFDAGSNTSKKVLYYDGFTLADGTTIYDCGGAEAGEGA